MSLKRSVGLVEAGTVVAAPRAVAMPRRRRRLGMRDFMGVPSGLRFFEVHIAEGGLDVGVHGG